MPNTFAMALQYLTGIKEHISSHQLSTCSTRWLRLIRFAPGDGFRRGHAWFQNVSANRIPRRPEPNLFVTALSAGHQTASLIGCGTGCPSDPRCGQGSVWSDRFKYLALSPDGSKCQACDAGRWLSAWSLVTFVKATTSPIGREAAAASRHRLRVLTTIRTPQCSTRSRIWAQPGRATRADRIIIAHGPKAKPLSAPTNPVDTDFEVGWLASSKNWKSLMSVDLFKTGRDRRRSWTALRATTDKSLDE